MCELGLYKYVRHTMAYGGKKEKVSNDTIRESERRKLVFMSM